VAVSFIYDHDYDGTVLIMNDKSMYTLTFD